MMIYITGDTHGDMKRFSTNSFPEQKEMTKEDYVIVCGDFGLVWNESESPYEKHWLDWLDAKPFMTLFVDGNHENHARLDAMPVHRWHGGNVHYLRPGVIHLMRGQYFEDVDGMSVFAFGGARSHDIQRLLDPSDPNFKEAKKRFDRSYIFYRVVGESWWEREMPDEAEMEEGRRNLASHGNKTDLIVTHEAPQGLYSHFYRLQPWVGQQEDPLRDYLEDLHQGIDYRYWFFGHHHDNVRFNRCDMLIYEQIIRIN